MCEWLPERRWRRWLSQRFNIPPPMAGMTEIERGLAIEHHFSTYVGGGGGGGRVGCDGTDMSIRVLKAVFVIWLITWLLSIRVWRSGRCCIHSGFVRGLGILLVR